MGTPLKNPPVFFTVAQARFNAVLKLSEYLPSVQDEMRKAGFPDFSTKSDIVLTVSVQDGRPTPIPGVAERYLFGTADKQHSFVLMAEALTLQSTNYGTFEKFSATFIEGLTLLHKIINLDFTERVGLRYLDHVAPQANDKLEAYIAPEVQGMSSQLGGSLRHTFSETQKDIGRVGLVSRVIVQDGPMTWPADIQLEEMVLSERFPGKEGRHALIDTDGSVSGRRDFSISAISRDLHDIHDVIRDAFRSVATDHAFKVWNSDV